jgi:hypothetical protein
MAAEIDADAPTSVIDVALRSLHRHKRTAPRESASQITEAPPRNRHALRHVRGLADHRSDCAAMAPVPQQSRDHRHLLARDGTVLDAVEDSICLG